LGQEEPKYGGLQLYVNEFRFSKMELASLKAYAAPQGSYTKRRHADAIKMVFDKKLFR
jgi:2-oxoglutarate dehydrogenase E1 component